MNVDHEYMYNQQHFFLSFSFFFWVSFLVGTSTGMKLWLVNILHLLLLVFYWSQGNFFKSDLNSFSIFGTSAQVDYFWVFLKKFIDSFLLNFSLWLSVDFVPHQNEWEFLRLFWSSLIHEFVNPRFDVVEGLG